MSLPKTPERDFTDIEHRLRSTYAHVANELVSERQDPWVVPGGHVERRKSRRHTFGVWTPRIVTLGAVAGMAFAGFNLANRGPASVIATATPSVFRSFPHLVPTAPTGYHLDSIFRELTPVSGFETHYGAASLGKPVVLVAGRGSWQEILPKPQEQVIEGRTVLLLNPDSRHPSAQLADNMCGTISIHGIERADLRNVVKHLVCRKFGREFRAELNNRKRSEIVYSGRIPSAYAQLRFYFVGNESKTDSFDLRVEPCQCDQHVFEIGSDPTTETRVINGRRVLATVGETFGSQLVPRAVFWIHTPTARFSMSTPQQWEWGQIEEVVRNIEEVDQATFTAILESYGIKEVSLVPWK
jgi:hypothetical protein